MCNSVGKVCGIVHDLSHSSSTQTTTNQISYNYSSENTQTSTQQSSSLYTHKNIEITPLNQDFSALSTLPTITTTINIKKGSKL